MRTSRSGERRHDERIAVECSVQIQPLDAPDGAGFGLNPCITRDLSAHGGGGNDPYPEWSNLLLTIEQIESNATRITSLIGSVVRTHPKPSVGRCLLGIRFAEGEVLDIIKRAGVVRFKLVV